MSIKRERQPDTLAHLKEPQNKHLKAAELTFDDFVKVVDKNLMFYLCQYLSLTELQNLHSSTKALNNAVDSCFNPPNSPNITGGFFRYRAAENAINNIISTYDFHSITLPKSTPREEINIDILVDREKQLVQQTVSKLNSALNLMPLNSIALKLCEKKSLYFLVDSIIRCSFNANATGHFSKLTFEDYEKVFDTLSKKFGIETTRAALKAAFRYLEPSDSSFKFNSNLTQALYTLNLWPYEVPVKKSFIPDSDFDNYPDMPFKGWILWVILCGQVDLRAFVTDFHIRFKIALFHDEDELTLSLRTVWELENFIDKLNGDEKTELEDRIPELKRKLSDYHNIVTFGLNSDDGDIFIAAALQELPKIG